MAEEIENSHLLTGPGCKVLVKPKIKIQSRNISECKDIETFTKTGISLDKNIEQKKELNDEYDKLNVREQRGTWKHPLDFLFSCISVTVGLGNVWRFPYLCYKNGGGVFLIIYLTTMIFCGIPIVLQEVIIGQYLGEGGSTIIGKVCPILKGVGMSTMVMVTYYNIYYCVIISWSLYYFIASFVTIPDVPWNTCNGWWNSKMCLLPRLQTNFSTNFETTNITTNISSSIHPDKVAAVTEFWRNRVLQINEGIE